MNYAGLPKQVAIKTLQPPTPSHILFMPLRCLTLLEVFFFLDLSVTMETRIGGGSSGHVVRQMQGRSIIIEVLWLYSWLEEITEVLQGAESTALLPPCRKARQCGESTHFTEGKAEICKASF